MFCKQLRIETGADVNCLPSIADRQIWHAVSIQLAQHLAMSPELFCQHKLYYSACKLLFHRLHIYVLKLYTLFDAQKLYSAAIIVLGRAVDVFSPRLGRYNPIDPCSSDEANQKDN